MMHRKILVSLYIGLGDQGGLVLRVRRLLSWRGTMRAFFMMLRHFWRGISSKCQNSWRIILLHRWNLVPWPKYREENRSSILIEINKPCQGSFLYIYAYNNKIYNIASVHTDLNNFHERIGLKFQPRTNPCIRVNLLLQVSGCYCNMWLGYRLAKDSVPCR